MNTVNAILDKYGRFGLDAATAVTTLGFAAAKATTKLGFSVTRSVVSTAVGPTGTALDFALGNQLGAGAALERATSVTFAAAEQLALIPIFVGESLTSASLIAAYSSIDALSSLFPGGEETSFSIASFINLMRNDWNNPELGEHLPEEHFSVGEATRALFAWGTLQSVTYDWQVTKWSKYLSEIPREGPIPNVHTRMRNNSVINVTGDVLLEGNKGQILTADITQTVSGADSLAVVPRHLPNLPVPTPRPKSQKDLKLTLRRLSKMCLAGYGGASLLFFGVPPKPPISSSEEKATLEAAVEESEKPQEDAQSRFPWWSMLLGKHDHDIFLHYASGGKRGTDVTAVIGDEARMPRFWVLTDHSRQQIVLVFRGTMTLNEVAVDLTTTDSDGDGDYGDEDRGDTDVPGSMPSGSDQLLRVPTSRRRVRSASFRSVDSFEGKHRYLVHGGILKMSLVMGGRSGPVFTAVKEALSRNQGYELVMCGHSLGAGVAGILGLKWADPKTCLTARSSGLPVGRRVSVYCFAPPAAYDPHLCELSKNLITSFVYFPRPRALRDMSRAAVWLCKAEAEGRPEGYSGITRRALRHKMGFGSRDDPIWFLSIRKTLEANMPLHSLYPPGRVLWARRYSPMEALRAQREEDGVRLFEVLDVEKVFTQIIFSRDMVSSHMAHTYDKVIEELQ
ncbi:alpha/beta-hydrolase [Lactarius indigo]|nr:alpha/beta-hydrolase [Lactarius indigo]